MRLHHRRIRPSAFALALACAAMLHGPSAGAAARPRRTGASGPRPSPAAAQPRSKPAVAPGESTAALLARARALNDALEYDRVVPLAEAVLARADADIEQRLDAYLLQGSCLAILGDQIEAEKPFRFLLRGRPSYDMPADTPPKILAVFRKVQVEERAIAEQLRELERSRIVRELKLTGGPEPEPKGGRPLLFEYRLRDPRGVVAAVQLQYRRGGEPDFSSLALQRDDGGTWKASLPGEWTQSDAGFRLEYFVTSADTERRELLALAGPASPLELPVSPGQVPDSRPFYRTGWFWAVTGAAVVALGTAGYFVWDKSRELPSTDLGVVEVH